MEVKLFEADQQISKEIKIFSEEKFKNALKIEEKISRETMLEEIKKDTIQHFEELYPDNERDIETTIDSLIKELLRSMILKEKIRSDGRQWVEI